MGVRQSPLFFLLSHCLGEQPRESAFLSGCNAYSCRCTVCCPKCPDELTEALLFSRGSVVSDVNNLPTLQRTHVLEYSRPGGAELSFPKAAPHQTFAFSHKMWEKPQRGKKWLLLSKERRCQWRCSFVQSRDACGQNPPGSYFLVSGSINSL